MMEINEIRVGNLIQFFGATKKIEYISNNAVVWLNEAKEPRYSSMSCHVNIGRCTPIPITADWLMILGFIHDSEQEFFNRGDICLSYSKDYEGYTLFVNHEYETGEPFKYLHQLQNLYFALTGKELEINL